MPVTHADDTVDTGDRWHVATCLKMAFHLVVCGKNHVTGNAHECDGMVTELQMTRDIMSAQMYVWDCAARIKSDLLPEWWLPH
jgi:hypothetical protein